MALELLDSATRPTIPPVLRPTRMGDQVRPGTCFKYYSLDTGLADGSMRAEVGKWDGLRRPRHAGWVEIEGLLGRPANDVGLQAGGGHCRSLGAVT